MLKNSFLTFMLTVLMSMVVRPAYAYQANVQGIYYNFSGTNATVTYLSNNNVYEGNIAAYSGNVVIPESVTYNGTTYSVTTIGDNAFRNCIGLTSITIPNSVTRIVGSAFDGCSGLTSVTIPSSVTSISNYAFNNCSGLTSMRVDAGNAVYDSRDNCNAIIKTATNTLISGCQNTTIPNSVTSIGDRAFWFCSGLTSITIPNSVTSIGNYAFFCCTGLTSITIPNSVTSIGENAFRGRGLTSIEIPNSVTSIGSYAFKECSSLTSVTFPNSVTSIGESAFSSSGLTSVTIPNSVTSIGDFAFSGCTGLTSVIIPNSVTSIGVGAFVYCSALVKVISYIENPFPVGNSAFSYVNNACVLEVPYGTRDAYIENGWSSGNFGGGIVENGDGITMATSFGTPREMIGYSNNKGLDFTNVSDVKAYVAVGYTKNNKDVLLARVNIVPANTGVVLRTTNPGVTVGVPFTNDDVYYANLLLPAVSNVTVNPTETIGGVDYTNLMIGPDEKTGELCFITFDDPNPCSNKSYLHVPTSYVQSTSNARLGMVFVDSETTDIESLLQGDVPADGVYYDLQGRKVTSAKKGLYIRNGKKVYIK